MDKIPQMLKHIIEEKERTSIRRVAKAIGVDHGSLYRALKQGGNPEGKTIEKILDYLGYEIRFFKSRGKEVNQPGGKGKSKKKEVV